VTPHTFLLFELSCTVTMFHLNYYVVVNRKFNKNNRNSQFGTGQGTVDGLSDLEWVEVGRRSVGLEN